MRDFEGRTAFVTGGASGIGLGMAQVFVHGVRRNALYIFTAPEFRPGIEARFDAIRRALGHDEARERTALDLIPNLVGSPIYDAS